MDQHRVDRLTRIVAGLGNRRGLLRGLAGVGLGIGLIRLPDAVAESKRTRRTGDKRNRENQARPDASGCLGAGAACKNDKQCCSEVCASKKGKRRCRGRGPAPCGPCQMRQRGRCVPAPDGTPCGKGRVCHDGECGEPDPDPTCATTCSGCCLDGACYPGDTGKLCGADGVTCAECQGQEICTSDRVCAPPACGNGGPCLVFVTSEAVGSELGGIEGADAGCQGLGEANGLPGTWRAWLSDGNGAPSNRFTHSPGPYQLRDGTVIADDWQDLTDGGLKAPITIAETGFPLHPPFETWTNTRPNGTRFGEDSDCANWTDAQHPGGSHVGLGVASDHAWTDHSVAPCANPAHLYCFQQS